MESWITADRPAGCREKSNIATLIAFTSDGGGERFSANWPLVGDKIDLAGGGIRVPCVAQWPRVVPPGGATDPLAITTDRTTTFFHLAGVPVARIDRALHWPMKYRNQRAARAPLEVPWAIEAHEYLFDVVADERERANLGRRDPERLAAMRGRYGAWNATMKPPPEDARYTLVSGKQDTP